MSEQTIRAPQTVTRRRGPWRDEEAYLEVTDLQVQFPTADGMVEAVQGLSYSLPLRRTLAIVGESGSGKSVSSMAVMGLHDARTARISGSIMVGGAEIVGLSEKELERYRGDDAAMIFQDPQSSLHPYFTIGDQIMESYRAHHSVSKRTAKDRAIDMLGRVGIPNPRRRVDNYPHEFSGGMRQRAMIAMALVNDPKLLIADEPTTALDVTVQAQILDLIADLQRDFGSAVVFITHDLGVVAEIADDILVMYAGKRHRVRPGRQDPRQARCTRTPGVCWRASRRCPATRCRCTRSPVRRRACSPYPAVVPSTRAASSASGCRTTCAAPCTPSWCRAPRTRAAPSRCHLEDPDRVFETEVLPRLPWTTTMSTETPLLRLENLAMHFKTGGDGFLARGTKWVKAVDGVDLTVHAGETVGLVGESGCGKSTTARLITRLLEPTNGKVLYQGTDIAHVNERRMRPYRRDIQLIFQDPYSSLNPRHTVGTIVGTALRTHDMVGRNGRAARGCRSCSRWSG